jgi:hypothetical protein
LRALGTGTLALETPREARFPEIERAIPDPRGMASGVHLDAADAAFLVEALARFPGAPADSAPVSLVLNGGVAVKNRRNWSQPARGIAANRRGSASIARIWAGHGGSGSPSSRFPMTGHVSSAATHGMPTPGSPSRRSETGPSRTMSSVSNPFPSRPPPVLWPAQRKRALS